MSEEEGHNDLVAVLEVEFYARVVQSVALFATFLHELATRWEHGATWRRGVLVVVVWPVARVGLERLRRGPVHPSAPWDSLVHGGFLGNRQWEEERGLEVEVLGVDVSTAAAWRVVLRDVTVLPCLVL